MLLRPLLLPIAVSTVAGMLQIYKVVVLPTVPEVSKITSIFAGSFSSSFFNLSKPVFISWESISGNTGESFGSGTQIWEEPIRELIDNGKLVTIFKKHAKVRGLNLK